MRRNPSALIAIHACTIVVISCAAWLCSNYIPINLTAFLCGGVFTALNLLLYRKLLSEMCRGELASKAVVALLLLKLPIIFLLVHVLMQYGRVAVLSAVAGMLTFIPAGVIAAERE